MSAKTSTSKSDTYQDIGAFWDEHDATDFGGQTEVEFDVNIQSQRRYYSLDKHLSLELKRISRARGISEETLLNMWVQEKISQSKDLDQSLTKDSTEPS